MSPDRFENFLQLVGPYIVKQRCRSRETITPAERLTITLRYLASGDSQQSQSFNFRVGRTTVCNIIHETCKGIWHTLNTTYLKPPRTQEDWKKIANEFFTEWNLPNFQGAFRWKAHSYRVPRIQWITIF